VYCELDSVYRVSVRHRQYKGYISTVPLLKKQRIKEKQIREKKKQTNECKNENLDWNLDCVRTLEELRDALDQHWKVIAHKSIK
jgi:hypothetical protein